MAPQPALDPRLPVTLRIAAERWIATADAAVYDEACLRALDAAAPAPVPAAVPARERRASPAVVNEASAEGAPGAPRPTTGEPPIDDAAAWERLGFFIGTHVHAKHMVRDTLPQALQDVERILNESRLGRLENLTVFHRSATVRVTSAPDPAQAQNPRRQVFLQGWLQGVLEETFNCHSYISPQDDTLWDLKLGDGRDQPRPHQP